MSKINLIRVERTRIVGTGEDMKEESYVEYKTYQKDQWGPTGKGGVYRHGDKAFYHYEGAQIKRDMYNTSRGYYGNDPWSWILETEKGQFTGTNKSQADLIMDIDNAVMGKTPTDEEQKVIDAQTKAEYDAKVAKEEAEDEYLEKLKEFSDHDMLWLAQRILNGLNSEGVKKFVEKMSSRYSYGTDKAPGPEVVIEGMKYVVEDNARKTSSERFEHITGG